MKTILIVLVNFYQKAISLYMLSGCRFTPSCSAYMKEAIELKGAGKGLWMGFKRVVRCHPFGGYGFDPVKNEK